MSRIMEWTYLVKTAFKPSVSFGGIVPFFVDNAKSDVFVRRASNKTD